MREGGEVLISNWVVELERSLHAGSTSRLQRLRVLDLEAAVILLDRTCSKLMGLMPPLDDEYSSINVTGILETGSLPDRRVGTLPANSFEPFIHDP